MALPAPPKASGPLQSKSGTPGVASSSGYTASEGGAYNSGGAS